MNIENNRNLLMKAIDLKRSIEFDYIDDKGNHTHKFANPYCVRTKSLNSLDYVLIDQYDGESTSGIYNDLKPIKLTSIENLKLLDGFTPNQSYRYKIQHDATYGIGELKDGGDFIKFD